MNNQQIVIFLLRKNLRKKLRTKRLFVLQILLICFCVAFVVTHPIKDNQSVLDEKNFEFYPTVKFDNFTSVRAKIEYGNEEIKWAIGFTPSNSVLANIVKDAATALQINEIIPYDNEKQMDIALIEQRMFVGIKFPEKLKNAVNVPLDLSITLKFPSKFRTFKATELRQNLWLTHGGVHFTCIWDETGGKDLYISEGVMHLQNALFHSIFKLIQKESGSKTTSRAIQFPAIEVHFFDRHTVTSHLEYADFANVYGFMFYLCFLLPAMHLIWEFSREKSENIMAHHSLFGFPYWTHWLAHFLSALISLILLDIIIITLLKIKWSSDYQNSSFYFANSLALTVFLLLHNIALILFCFVIVVICSTVNTAILTALIIWILMYAIFAIVFEHSNELWISLIALGFLFFNNVMPYGMRSLQKLNKNAIAIMRDHFEIPFIYGMLLVDSLLYLLMLYFLQRLRSTPYREKKPLKGVKSARRELARQISSANFATQRETNLQDIEFKSLENTEAVQLNHINKFKNKRAIIRDLSLKIFQNEITVLLGHNGAGKTTLLCIIAGFHKPSKGMVQIYGVLQTEDNSIKIRKNLCACLPNNTLFDYLTIKEHLIYAMTIKKVDESVKKLELLKWLELLKMENQDDKVVAKLNFENKRLICLAMALCGNTKIVLLDEPTMHMMVGYRKRFWDIVRSQKRGRCIIVSTNSVAEAESVGDRIAILDNGELLAYGTPFFLKIKYASVYYLICLKDSDCETIEVSRIVKQFMPTAQIEYETEEQIHYTISREYAKTFPILFRTLEENSVNLKLVSVDVLGSQLSEVYTSFSGRSRDFEEPEEKDPFMFSDLSLHKGCTLYMQQIWAMIFKKLSHQMPHKAACIMIMLSTIAVLILAQISRFTVIERVNKEEIRIGYQLQSSSEWIFNKVLDADYNRRYQMVQFDFIDTYEDDLRIVTWGRSVKRILDSDRDEIDIMAISLPDENNNLASIWVNKKIFHSAPLCLNLMHNALLRMIFKTSAYKIEMINKPLRIIRRDKFEFLKEDLSHMKFSLTIGTVTPFVISSFIYYIVVERETNMRSLQFLAGIRIPIYWLVPLCWDLCKAFAFIFIFTIIFLFLTVEGYELEEKFALLMTLNIYCFSAMCQTYLLSFYFNTAKAAFLGSALIHLITGLFAHVVQWHLLKSNLFWWIAMFSPDFAMLHGMTMIYIGYSHWNECKEESKLTGISVNQLCNEFPECCDKLLTGTNGGLLPSIIFMISTGMIFMLTLLVVEYYAYERRFNTQHTKFLHSAYGPNESIEVLNEKQRITELTLEEIGEYNIVVDQLEDCIPHLGTKLNTISFSVNSGECLVILGEKNCGTTNLIQQLIGEKGFSFGDIYVQGCNMKENLDLVRTKMGFCPKEMGLLTECTGNELMRIMCLIRGVPKEDMGQVIWEMVFLLEMEDFVDIKIANLSMEKKRRINIAIAFIVNVQVVLIDEPTAGVSALTRRLISNVLRYARYIGKSIVLTTTDPWECEALADKVIIFSNGEMLFYGSLQHLRNKFAYGFNFEVKLKKDGATMEEIKNNIESDISNMKRFVTYMAVNSELRSSVDGTMKFYVPIRHIIWSRVFELIEKNRQRLHIEDYIINQSSFEDIMHNLMETREARTNDI